MRVCARKAVTVEGNRIEKHEEGTLIAVTRDTRVCDDYYYIVEFKDHGKLTVNKNDFDLLDLRSPIV